METSAYYLNLYGVPLAVLALTSLGLGCFLVIREKASRISRDFFLISFFLFVYYLAFALMYCSSAEETALFWAKASYLGVPFIPVALYQFTVTLLHIRGAFRTMLPALWLIAIGCAAIVTGTDWVLTGMREYWWGYYLKFGTASVPIIAGYFLLLFFTWNLFRQRYRAELSNAERRRLKPFVYGLPVAYLAAIDFLPNYGVPMYPFGNLFFFIFLILAMHSMLRHPLVQITPALASKKIIETMKDALLVLDLEGVICLTNTAATQLFGVPREELIGTPAASIFPDSLFSRKSKTIFSEAAMRERELAFHGPADSTVVLSLSSSIMSDQQGAAVAAVCIFHDITERKKSEETLQRMNEELERQNRELHGLNLFKDGMLRDVSHELKVPVAKQSMNLQMLREMASHHGLEKDIGHVVSDMSRTLDRQSRVIRNLLDLARLEGGGRNFRKAGFRLDRLVEEVLEEYREVFTQEEIVVEKGLQALTVESDEEMLWHVFSNLLHNAVKFLRPGVHPRIAVVLSFREDAFVVRIADNGRGLTEREREKVFDKFYQASPSNEGSGVGLTLCKMITEGLGGTIGFEDGIDGAGTTAVVTLPR